MAVSTREGLKEYALRNLGAPVVEINVDDDQLEDRLDEALEHWAKYHYEGTEQIYMKAQIRASEIVLTASVAANFTLSETITGGTSGATAVVVGKEFNPDTNANALFVVNIIGTFRTP